jgi:hypothetical protein
MLKVYHVVSPSLLFPKIRLKREDDDANEGKEFDIYTHFYGVSNQELAEFSSVIIG